MSGEISSITGVSTHPAGTPRGGCRVYCPVTAAPLTTGVGGCGLGLCADRAKDKRTGEIVALKKVRMDRERDGTLFTSLVCPALCPVPCHLAGAPPCETDGTRLPPVCAGMPVTALRELRILQMCEHPNIVQLKCVVTGNQKDR